MERDPARPIGQTSEQRLAQRVRELEARMDALLRSRSAVTVGSGPPGPGVTTPFYIDEVAHRLYWRESSAWRWAAGT